MKKQVSLWLAVLLAALIFLYPCSLGFAGAKNDDEGLYKVSETVYADAYMLIDLNDANHPLLAQKNQDKKKYPASLTKIATAMVILNNMKDLMQKTTVSQDAIEMLAGTDAQLVGLRVGEEVTMEKLLSLIMVYSACDACTVAAEEIAGSVPEFVDMMNDWAKEVGCTSTHFVNCDGLHDEDHYSTAADIARMTLAAMKNDIFMKISTQTHVDFHEIRYYHTNLMLDDTQPLYYENARGIKTGSTDEAGYCLVTTAIKKGYRYLAIVMDSPMQEYEGAYAPYSFVDAATLFDWAFDNLKYTTILEEHQSVTDVRTSRAKKIKDLPLVTTQEVKILLPASADASAIKIEPVDPPEKLQAPLKKGTKVCKANIVYNGKVLSSVDLCTGDTLELSGFYKFLNFLKAHQKMNIIIIICVILVGIVLFFMPRKRRSKKKGSAASRTKRTYTASHTNRTYTASRTKKKATAPRRRKRHEMSEKQKQYEEYKRQKAREGIARPRD